MLPSAVLAHLNAGIRAALGLDDLVGSDAAETLKAIGDDGAGRVEAALGEAGDRRCTEAGDPTQLQSNRLSLGGCLDRDDKRRLAGSPSTPLAAGTFTTDLGRQRHRIGGVALEHLDRDRTAVRGAEQTDDQLRAVTAMIAAIAITGELAAAPFQVGGGDIIEQQRPVLQVPARQRGFDETLLRA